MEDLLHKRRTAGSLIRAFAFGAGFERGRRATLLRGMCVSDLHAELNRRDQSCETIESVRYEKARHPSQGTGSARSAKVLKEKAGNSLKGVCVRDSHAKVDGLDQVTLCANAHARTPLFQIIPTSFCPICEGISMGLQKEVNYNEAA